MTKKTIKQLVNAREVIQKYINFENGKWDKSTSKINYAVFKFDNGVALHNIIKEKVEDIDIEYCSIDDKGNIMYNEKGNKLFTKENLRLKLKALKDIDNIEIDFEPYFISKENYENIITDSDDLDDLRCIFIQ